MWGRVIGTRADTADGGSSLVFPESTCPRALLMSRGGRTQRVGRQPPPSCSLPCGQPRAAEGVRPEVQPGGEGRGAPSCRVTAGTRGQCGALYQASSPKTSQHGRLKHKRQNMKIKGRWFEHKQSCVKGSFKRQVCDPNAMGTFLLAHIVTSRQATNLPPRLGGHLLTPPHNVCAIPELLPTLPRTQTVQGHVGSELCMETGLGGQRHKQVWTSL